MPTGLHVDDTTETSITWHWNAVEGALGYVVQASMDEMWDDTDTVMFDGVPFTTMTTYTAMDLEPETSVAVRVAAAAGSLEAPLVSAWTTHVTGMSAMPPPPPPPAAPDPVMVTFSLPDDESEMMEADKDDDEATAKASVNPDIMVESNATAIITPMFVDGAAGVGINAGSNTPFGLVDWDMLQSDVLGGGATFMVQRTMVGANQEMEPSGDVAYVTCGPFACMEGSDPPEISIANSAACQGWDPELDLQVGRIDNDVVADDTDDTGNDGVDLGMVFKSSLAMKVKHSWSGVANGRNTDTTVDVAKSSTGATMGMNWVMDVIQTDAGPD
ncbi:MAG: fibronectin type III domain-containing protein, partial [Acidobacteria bacterium]|nr:fibronectin type III domain-containing protein [Acidobacteriota bacterium]